MRCSDPRCGNLPAAILRGLERHFVHGAAGPAPEEIHALIFGKDKPFLFHDTRHDASLDSRHFLRGERAIQWYACSLLRKWLRFPISAAGSDSRAHGVDGTLSTLARIEFCGLCATMSTHGPTAFLA